MPEPYFERLRQALVEQGVSARYIDRLVAELEDHCADAALERWGRAEVPRDRHWLQGRLGEEAIIVAQVMARAELRGRFCGLRAALRPCRAPSAAGASLRDAAVAAPILLRWGASIACGTLITAALLLVMAQSILLNV